MTKRIKFPPLENGLDYLTSVVEHLRDEPDQRDLKYAVLHLQAAVEVLLKARLIRQHWSLVFKDPNTASQSAFAKGDFQSIGLKDTLTRLTDIGVEVPKPAREQFLRLNKQRNKLQHFGLEEQAIAIESLAGQVLDGLLCFIRDHLRPGADHEDEQLLDQTQELIREEMERINTLVAARWFRIGPDLTNAGTVVHCPDCQHSALPIDEDLRCRFCDRTWEPDEAASEYAGIGLGLGLSWHESVGALDGPLHTCMDCQHATLVRGATVQSNPNAHAWVCFNGCLAVGDQEITGCLKCGVPIRRDHETGVCEDCLHYAGGRD
ncbi:MAG: hypothetical protein DLM62_21365 [Pseudonocardiales bacterium]|nr:MAG: hypothetical protein DLM62_21365 [Pseudonocardiales bacterium]